MIDKTEGEHNKSIEPAAGGAARFASVSPKRRRLISGGIAAAPILASMEVRNALAVDCLTPSGNLSGNVSHTQGIGSCAGVSAACWSGRAQAAWPSGVSDTTQFHSLFQTGSVNFGTNTLRQVVGLTGTTDPNQISAYFVAAYLNVRAGLILIPGLNQTQIIGMLQTIWGQWVSTGFYQANATTQWNSSQIKLYLTTNGIVSTATVC